MKTLSELLGGAVVRQRVIDDCALLIDNQVRSKGLIIKGAYATVKAIKRTFVPDVIASLLPEWLQKMDTHYAAWLTAKSGTFSDFVIARSSLVAEDLLSVTDARAAKTSHATAKKAYQKMRDSAKQHVMEAIPELARTMQRHLPSA